MELGDGQSSLRLPYPSAQPVYRAAEQWRDRALIEDRSLFDDRQLDSVQTGRELVEHFIDNPDVGSGTFVNKLRDQLGTVSTDAVQVAAELLYVHFLVVSTRAVSSKTKLDTVRSVLAFRESGTGDVPEDLADALRAGLAHPGQAFNNFRWKMFAFLIRFYVEVKALPVDRRRVVLSDRAAVQEIFDRLDQQTVWSQMWAVEHLLFPDLTPPMLNRDDRAAVLETWPRGDDVGEVLGSLEPNLEYGNRSAVMPYYTPYREQWKGADPALEIYTSWGCQILDSGRQQHQDEIDYKLAIAGKLNEILQAAAAGDLDTARLRTVMRAQDFNLVHYFPVDDFLKWVESDPGRATAALSEFERYQGAEALDRFLEHVPAEGQLKGPGARISLGSVLLMATDPRRYPPFRDRWARTTARLTNGSMRAQESATPGEQYLLFLERLDAIRNAMASAGRPLEDRLSAQSLARLVSEWTDISDWDDDTYQQFDSWRTGKAVSSPAAPPRAAEEADDQRGVEVIDSEPRTLEDLAVQLSFAEEDLEWLEETVALLQQKKQLILQGPPGTGKTYLARALAKFIAGTPDRVRVVQFHPSYSYEDFVMGLRPDPQVPGRFSVAKGPLVVLAEEARAKPQEQYVLIVDEINRANVPAVFGELYYLLEYRGDEITMTYGGEPFSIPENLLLIGTMNTADRSITALDSAMRRRFYVRDLRPGERPLDGMLRSHLTQRAPALAWLADLLDEANKRVGERDLAVGPSFFMGEPPTERDARRAWENSVLPTLRETFYSRPEMVESLDFGLLKGEVTESDGSDGPD